MRDYSVLCRLYQSVSPLHERLETALTEDPADPEVSPYELAPSAYYPSQSTEQHLTSNEYALEPAPYESQPDRQPSNHFHNELLADENPTIDPREWKQQFTQLRLDTWDMCKGYQLAHDFKTSQGLVNAPTQRYFFDQVFAARRRIEWDLGGRIIGPTQPWDISDPSEPERRVWKQDFWRGFALARSNMHPIEQQAVDQLSDQKFSQAAAFNGIELPNTSWR